ncbi:hypothetical protein ALP07_200014 [Pseudomonas savastanoi pv. glycinea]|nr:hypothetical protein ALP07_200014 [Pseudomonas savastanoi pv. glycinea]
MRFYKVYNIEKGTDQTATLVVRVHFPCHRKPLTRRSAEHHVHTTMPIQALKVIQNAALLDVVAMVQGIRLASSIVKLVRKNRTYASARKANVHAASAGEQGYSGKGFYNRHGRLEE